MKRTTPQQIGELVNQLIKDYRLEQPTQAGKAMWLWGQIVGEGINGYTTRRKVEGTVLHVWISSAPLRNELMYSRQQVMDAINKELGSPFLTEIRLH